MIDTIYHPLSCKTPLDPMVLPCPMNENSSYIQQYVAKGWFTSIPELTEEEQFKILVIDEANDVRVNWADSVRNEKDIQDIAEARVLAAMNGENIEDAGYEVLKKIWAEGEGEMDDEECIGEQEESAEPGLHLVYDYDFENPHADVKDIFDRLGIEENPQSLSTKIRYAKKKDEEIHELVLNHILNIRGE